MEAYLRLARAAALGALVAAPGAWAAQSFTYSAIDAYGRRVELGTVVVEHNGAPRVAAVTGIDPARARALLAADLRMRPDQLIVGERWSERATRVDAATGERREVRLTGRVVDTETITTRAGTFDTVVIERRLLLGDAGRYRTETRRTEREWFSPKLNAPVRKEVWEEYSDPTIPRPLQNMINKNRELYELVSTGSFASGARPGS
jgi:hypothetical protein